MKILLHSNRTIEEVKEDFNNFYPYLKIVFVTEKRDSDGSTAVEEIDSSVHLTDVSSTFQEGDIDIKSTDTVKEVRQKFESQYGLPVRIFRKQNGVWMNTDITDDLNLHEQDTWGREASKPLKIRLGDHSRGTNLSLGKQ